MSTRKAGAISNSERKFILENMATMSIEDMAKKISRHVSMVEKVIQMQTSLPEADNNTVRWHLKRSLNWKHMKDEFTESELDKIEDQYTKYVQQFQENINATEEVQILNLIKIEILMDRNLKGKMKIGESIGRYSKMIKSVMDGVDDDFSALSENQQKNIMDLEKAKQESLHAESSRTQELVMLQKEHNVLMGKVMGSRDQRITEVLNQKVSVFGLIKQLIDVDRQKQDSRILELYGKAADAELIRLSKPHKFLDDSVDNPVLSFEVVERFTKEEEDEKNSEDINDSNITE